MQTHGIALRDEDLAAASSTTQRAASMRPSRSISVSMQRIDMILKSFIFSACCAATWIVEAACRFLEEALFISPVFPEARGQLAIALCGLADLRASSGLLDEVQRLLEKALESAPGDAQSLQGLGRVALMLGYSAKRRRAGCFLAIALTTRIR